MGTIFKLCSKIKHGKMICRFKRLRISVPVFGACAMSRALMGGLFHTKGDEDVKYYLKIAGTAQKQNNPRDAENYYHMALHSADQLFKKKEIDPTKYRLLRVYVYDAMANMAYNSGDYGKAERLYKETMKLLLAMGRGKTDNAMLEISLKLANMYMVMEMPVEAESGFNFVIDSLEEKIKNKTEEFLAEEENCYGLLGIGCENYAKYLIGKENHTQAESLLKKAEEIARKYLGEKHPQRLVLLNDIASVQIHRQDYAEAEKSLTAALKIGEDIDDNYLPLLYCNMGSLHLRTGGYDKAMEWCQRAYELGTERKNKSVARNALICMKKAEAEAEKENST
ncbi:hypothetical protein FSP39_022156 [Pinctada imbricata]|uniref:MalT-like TPR region domain-containing protein n=1 Tax=Pinctada imbricata TaxID=66713 RepID=A0AA88XWT4_PINIB|nr:hypothetical protein FSP39_022156 [Pinctada imbricata]